MRENRSLHCLPLPHEAWGADAPGSVDTSAVTLQDPPPPLVPQMQPGLGLSHSHWALSVRPFLPMGAGGPGLPLVTWRSRAPGAGWSWAQSLAPWCLKPHLPSSPWESNGLGEGKSPCRVDPRTQGPRRQPLLIPPLARPPSTGVIPQQGPLFCVTALVPQASPHTAHLPSWPILGKVLQGDSERWSVQGSHSASRWIDSG